MFSRIAQRLRAYANKDGRGYPDWAMRYVPVVQRFRRKLHTGPVLEIGANENGLARFVHTPVVVANYDINELKASRKTPCVLPVQADIAALPFPDHSFTTCISMDTFEHLEPVTQEAAVNELARVLAKDGAGAVAFPVGDAALKAEQTIQQEYEALTGQRLHWFDEHTQDGLPSLSSVQDAFAAALPNHRVTSGHNTNLALWRWMWRVMLCAWPGRGNALFQALLRFITPLLARCHFGVCYRVIVWMEPSDE